MRRRPSCRAEAGFTVLEVTVALVIVTVLVTAALGGIRAHQVTAVRSFDRLAASRAAASRLETLRDPSCPLAAGSTSFAPDMPGATGAQQVTSLEPGLFEVAVVVEHAGANVRARLVTRLARETEP